VLGLALGGGAARGFAHIGVIQALEEAGIKPQVVVGTSAGSLVAAMYASGKTPAQLQQLASTMEENAITDWTIPIFNRGVLRGEALANYVNANIRHKLIETMPIRLGIVATDLKTGAATTFQQGDTGLAVRASSAVPTVFLPVKWGNSEYVDGGLVAPVPVAQTKALGAELVVAVDISSPPEGNPTDGMVQVLLQTTAIMGKSINAYALKEAEVVVRPALVGVKSTDFSARQRSIDAGKAAMQAQIPLLKRLLARQ
jgi:NTE family protein